MTVFPRESAAPRLNRRTVIKLASLPPLVAVMGRVRPAGAQDKLVVTMVTDTAGLGDRNFNDAAKKALDRAAADFGIDPKVIESTETAQYVTNLTDAANQSDLTCGIGFLLTDAITAVAQQFPDDKFLLIDSVSDAPNVAGITFREQEGAFLAGIVAGLTTKTNKLGVVNGQRIPPVIRYEVGFRAGVASVNSSATVNVATTDTFSDPALGKEFALAQFNDGADIIFPVAGKTGPGCYESAKEKGPEFLVIGADVDQDYLAPGQQLCVAYKGVEEAVYRTIESVVQENFQPGSTNVGINEGMVDLTHLGAMVTPETAEIAARYKAAVAAGTVKPPATDDELATFQPTAPDALPPATPESGTPPA